MEEVIAVATLSEDVQLLKDEKAGKEIPENDKKRLDSMLEDNIIIIQMGLNKPFIVLTSMLFKQNVPLILYMNCKKN